MTSKVFRDRVSIGINKKGEIEIRKDPKGAFGAEDAEKIANTIIALAKKHKAPISQWNGIWVAKGGEERTNPVLLVGNYGKPYIGYLPPKAQKIKEPDFKKLA